MTWHIVLAQRLELAPTMDPCNQLMHGSSFAAVCASSTAEVS
jgi:hypothetical protein